MIFKQNLQHESECFFENCQESYIFSEGSTESSGFSDLEYFSYLFESEAWASEEWGCGVFNTDNWLMI